MFGKNSKLLVLFVIALGFTLRLVLFAASPPNNAYDDHLEVVNIYSIDYLQPQPSQCWECYQPPAYYLLGSLVLNVGRYLDIRDTWKVVQFINTFLAFISLILLYLILGKLHIKETIKVLVLSFVAVLPRDIFTSVMIGNDYLLVFLSVMSVYLFLTSYEVLMNNYNRNKFIINFSLLVLTSILAIYTKQHGLLLITFPLLLFGLSIWKRKSRVFTTVTCVILCSWIVSNYSHTYLSSGHLLVSNQHYFYYADKQPPGDLGSVEFFSFRIRSLFTNPFLSEATLSSLPTEIFARTFFDYEWRFISPKAEGANLMGIASYVFGLLWVFVALSIWAGQIIKNKSTLIGKALNNLDLIAISIVALGFSIVPILQTIRFPHFSSMKSMFMLPGIWLFIIVSAKYFPLLKAKYLYGIISLNVLFGLISTVYILLNLDFSLTDLSGPLWLLPK